MTLSANRPGKNASPAKTGQYLNKEAPAYLPGPAYAVQAMLIGGAFKAIIL